MMLIMRLRSRPEVRPSPLRSVAPSTSSYTSFFSNWFTKKFDYRNAQEPWKNSRDALPRGMRKMTGLRDIGN